MCSCRTRGEFRRGCRMRRCTLSRSIFTQWAIHFALVTLDLVFLLAADEPSVWDRVDLDDLLEEPVEEQAACLGASAIEPERELVQIVVQVLVTHSSLVG